MSFIGHMPPLQLTIDTNKFAAAIAQARAKLQRFAVEHGADLDDWRDFYGLREDDSADPVYGEFREDGWLGNPDAWKGE